MSAIKVSRARTRERGGFIPLEICYQNSYDVLCTEPGPVYTELPHGIHGGFWESMTDVVTRDFKQLKASGKVVFNPMSQVKRTAIITSQTPCRYRSRQYSCKETRKHADHQMDGGYIPWVLSKTTALGLTSNPEPYSLFSSTDVEEIAVEASTSVLAQRGRGSANLVESLAEFGSTAQMLHKPFSSFKILFTKMNRLASAGISLSSLWLQYRYGIKPLISDIVAILDALQAVHNKPRRETTRQQVVSKRTDSIEHHRSGVGHSNVVTSNTTDEVIVRAMSLDEVQISALASLGFTGKNILTLPWELVSLSFVLDWFLSVGDFINSLVPAAGFNNLGAAVVIKRRIETNHVVTSVAGTGDYEILVPGQGEFYCLTETKSRGDLRSPAIVLRDDPFLLDLIVDENSRALWRATDLAAIVAQLAAGVAIKHRSQMAKAIRGTAAAREAGRTLKRVTRR